MSNTEPNKPASFDNPLDFVDKLCELIFEVNPPLHPIMFEQGRQDKIEMIKRDLTDYLLVADGRNGKMKPESDSELPSNKGRLEQAKRYAIVNFDEWNNVTEFVSPHSGYYYEVISLIEDAAEFGFGIAHGQSAFEIKNRIDENKDEK